MARAAIADPIKVFRYLIDIGSGTAGGSPFVGFSECSGLSVETDVVEYRGGGMNETPQKSAGLSKYGDITLKRGQLDPTAFPIQSVEFLNWVQQVHSAASMGNQPMYRKEVRIYQQNALNVIVYTWVLRECWPKSWKPGSDLNGSTSENSIEELVLVHEGFELV